MGRFRSPHFIIYFKEFKLKKIVVMGIGNYIFTDEGIGVHAIMELEKLKLPENVELVDCGTASMFTNSHIADADILIAIDAIASDKEPGAIVVYDKEDIMLSRVPMKISPHQIGFQETLLHARLRGDIPDIVKLVGVVPKSLDASIVLTDECQKSLPEVVKIVLDFIEEFNK